MELLTRLQELRKKYGYSQEQLSEMLGVSRQAVSKWESGQTTPDINNLMKLSEIYNVSTDYLLFGKENVPQIVYKDRIVYQEKKAFKKLHDLPRSFRIALAICIISVTVGVIVPALFFLIFDIWVMIS